MRVGGRSGQATVEYVLAVLALLVVITAMTWVIAAAERSVETTEALVSSDYP